jgi:Protein of unknown function (DUF2911)
MQVRKMSFILGLVLAVAIVSPVVDADEINQATKVTFSQPVQIPGKTLPAGSYLLQLAGSLSDREIVQVFNDKHELLTTLFAIPRQRAAAGEHTAFVLANKGEGSPEAVVAWFYPGSTEGHQLLYPKSERQQLGRVKTETVVAGN